MGRCTQQTIGTFRGRNTKQAGRGEYRRGIVLGHRTLLKSVKMQNGILRDVGDHQKQKKTEKATLMGGRIQMDTEETTAKDHTQPEHRKETNAVPETANGNRMHEDREDLDSKCNKESMESIAALNST